MFLESKFFILKFFLYERGGFISFPKKLTGKFLKKAAYSDVEYATWRTNKMVMPLVLIKIVI